MSAFPECSLRRQRERGVAVIEFALVFTLVFGFFWALVSYTIPLILLQAMNRAASEGARVAATVPSSTTDYDTAVVSQATAEMTRQMTWLSGWTTGMTTTASFVADANCPVSRPNCVLQTQLKIANYNTTARIKPLKLPGLGQFPALPANLVATARVIL